MKTILCILLASSVFSYAVEYTNSILETHYPRPDNPTGSITTELHTNIANVDDAPGKKGIQYETTYELFATQKDDISNEYLLDTKTVFTGGPAAEITITSADPYTLIPRTRADQPYTVTYSVSNLLSTSDSEDQRFTSTILHHQGVNSSGGTLEGAIEQINNNVTAVSKNYNPADFFSGDATAIQGSITFSMNENTSTDADEFASQTITVLPKHSGSIGNIGAENDGDPSPIYDSVPNVIINVTNLYPRSDAFLVAFKSEDINNKEKYRVVENSQLQNLTQNLKTFESIPVSTLNSVITEKGSWVLELRVNTPFGEELVDRVTFEKSGTLKINVNNVTTQE